MSGFQPSTVASAQSHQEVFEVLADLAKAEAYTARAILALFICWNALPPLVHGRFGWALLDGFLGFCVGSLVFAFVNRFFFGPRRRAKVKALAEALADSLRRVPAPITQSLCWHDGTPGALVITRHGELALCDQSTEYDELWLKPKQIVSASVERQATHITSTHHSGSFTFGGVTRGGLLGGYTAGGTSKSVTRTVETAFLEVHYQLELNGRTFTTVVPFGGDRRSAEALGASISRLVYVEPDLVTQASRGEYVAGPE